MYLVYYCYDRDMMNIFLISIQFEDVRIFIIKIRFFVQTLSRDTSDYNEAMQTSCQYHASSLTNSRGEKYSQEKFLNHSSTFLCLFFTFVVNE